MAYNVSKDQGGDNKQNTSWMEKCVDSVMSKNPSIDKSNAIAICKAQLKKSKESEFIQLDEEVVSSFLNYKEQWIRRYMDKGNTYIKGSSMFNIHLYLNNYNF